MTSQSDDHDDVDLERVLLDLRRRVAIRRHSGDYPSGLEDDLDEHFRRLVSQRPTTVSRSELDNRVEALDQTVFDTSTIPTESGLPGGSLYHQAVVRAVSRPLHRIASQFDSVRIATVAALAEVSNLVGQLDTKGEPLEGELTALHARLAELERGLDAALRVGDQIERLAAGLNVPSGAADEALFFDYEAFERRFRGDPSALLERYRELADLFEGLDPVFDFGCGAGEFLELLGEVGSSSFGVDLDRSMIEAARARNVDARVGDGLAVLEERQARSLGGVVSLQVIEHLPAGVTARLIELAAEKLYPGGLLVLETPNVAVLGTHANAWVLDPTHIRPVHPDYLAFVCEQAGFSKVELRYASTPTRRLELLQGDDADTGTYNRNVELLNDVLFGPQDVAVIATR
ncbi:MAG: class I SAM-dependent methyltransferase [Actinomycetia bacterium]|nr:class I SAM-dependent methyltransferase [Actinomycetes bacterium]